MGPALVDSMILMHYDNNQKPAVDWREESVENGWQFYVSIVSVMERLKGISGISGSRERALRDFEDRLQTLRRERKIVLVLPLTKRVAQRAHSLILEYCRSKTPPSDRSRMEALICDMLIAATALEKRLPLFTFNAKDFSWISGLTWEKPDYEVDA
ncbi:MAG: PIN domain-containing protein [Blastocatellia bacterium]|nr:PIN domain-containing protein [Blastocatellia bacterium]MDW8166910.1 PIN domain-containing protein [Acidobacteriota bacterium]MDW8226226.1 PIN domain-containing protein [Anaerolineales bacterium]